MSYLYLQLLLWSNQQKCSLNGCYSFVSGLCAHINDFCNFGTLFTTHGCLQASRPSLPPGQHLQTRSEVERCTDLAVIVVCKSHCTQMVGVVKDSQWVGEICQFLGRARDRTEVLHTGEERLVQQKVY